MLRLVRTLHDEAAAISPQGVLRWSMVWLAAILLAVFSLAARAQDEDLPGRVGRIAEFGGQLYLSPEERATDWATIGLNYPVTSGDNLWVSTDGRAEVDYGGGQFRLAGDTNLHVSRLDERQLALFVAQGRVIVRVRVLDAGDSARVDTPNTQVELTRLGLYRIEVSPDRQVTTVSVREGEALIALAGGAQQALPGQTATVVGQDPAAADIQNAVVADGFDTWSADRDRRYEQSRASPYVSRQMVGAVELDEYGMWQQDPTYGAVWYPSGVAVDWAPYRDGYWAWSGGWGWTWVDSAPWGYAPFHYGRWAYVGGRWGWCPGAYVARPYWAPALVAWYGGPGWSFSASYGAPVYGWIPLGWRDPYIPWWGRRECGERCWSHYNRPYAVNYAEFRSAPPTRYANAAVPGAITAVAGATLIGAKPVASNRVRVPQQMTRTAPVLAAAPAVKPLHIPAAKPGTGGTPPPASTFYPTSRRPVGAGGSTYQPVPSTGATSAAPGAAPRESREVRRAPAAPGAAIVTPAPQQFQERQREVQRQQPQQPQQEQVQRQRAQHPQGQASQQQRPQQQPEQQRQIPQQQPQSVQRQQQQVERQRAPQPQGQAQQQNVPPQPQRAYSGQMPAHAAPPPPARSSVPPAATFVVPAQPGAGPRVATPAPAPPQGGQSAGPSRSGQRQNPTGGGGQPAEKPGKGQESSGPAAGK